MAAARNLLFPILSVGRCSVLANQCHRASITSYRPVLVFKETIVTYTTAASYRTLQAQSRIQHPTCKTLESCRVNVGSQRVMYSNGTSPKKVQSYTGRIKVILKEYGSVGVIFHTVVSLFSLGTCYFLVSNGLDVDQILNYFNVESSGAKKGASTFAIAYMFHKFLLPLRATITIVSVPMIVRQLRARGWMKEAVSKITQVARKARK